MNREDANCVAATLLIQEQAKSEPLRKAGTAAASVAQRMRTSLITLMAAYVGWRIATEFPGAGVPPVLAGALLGLVAGTLVPARKT